MNSRLPKLVDLLSKKHPELLVYYELSNSDQSLNVTDLTSAYDLDKQYRTSFRTAVYAAYLSIKKAAKRKETIERLEKEYTDQIAKSIERQINQ